MILIRINLYEGLLVLHVARITEIREMRSEILSLKTEDILWKTAVDIWKNAAFHVRFSSS